MKTKIINQNPKTIALICDTGDEIISALTQTAEKFCLAASHFTAIGAFQEVTLGFFDLRSKDYQKTVVPEQLEVLSLIGDVSLEGNKRQIHAHVVVGLSDATTRGGHLVSGVVRPTLEVILIESPTHLRRRHNSQVGLALIDLDKSS